MVNHTYAPDRVVATWTGKDVSALERMWTRVGEPPERQGDVELVSGRVSLDAPAMPDGEPVPSVKVCSRATVADAARYHLEVSADVEFKQLVDETWVAGSSTSAKLAAANSS